MQELWRLVSSPRHLIVFEAAARHGSFTRAAAELNVQQPAVSAAIKELEASLGVMLFHRAHRRVTLTAAGTRLASDVTRALDQVLSSARAVRQLTHNEHVTLNASTAFTHYWMMPRLRDLHDRHPDIDLRLQSSDREPEIDAEHISLAVRRGRGDWPDCHAVRIASEVICPVASPRVLEAAGLRMPSDLLSARLIHLEEPVRERPGWRDWFAAFGINGQAPEAGLRLNDYALVLQAAIAGEGIAFGWRHVTEPLIRQGLLAARRDWSWETRLGFYLVWSRARPLGEAAAQVRDWIVESAGRS
ncbi:LysR substrate-binding domain-containing protein [Aestuariicoccus sp. MJ-SS9]|uniref:LysR substrate-binding domain-containing protein n=1 Tax=Aestuariicoccus sp. MJ-SS9 TaxID=3079855 RepID=UPI0029138B73|nr:LysR substrate-binding domain-containing protein [Aestuariicoccus sp. MJ-SS9]MDU8910306.1 LysR substrate-binding domain-containing protein [Aestuariicoccus sp. MJ-SS9]